MPNAVAMETGTIWSGWWLMTSCISVFSSAFTSVLNHTGLMSTCNASEDWFFCCMRLFHDVPRLNWNAKSKGLVWRKNPQICCAFLHWFCCAPMSMRKSTCQLFFKGSRLFDLAYLDFLLWKIFNTLSFERLRVQPDQKWRNSMQKGKKEKVAAE